MIIQQRAATNLFKDFSRQSRGGHAGLGYADDVASHGFSYKNGLHRMVQTG